jgi:hypothetical protein
MDKIYGWIKLGFLWIYLYIHGWILRISIALYNTEEAIMKADPSDLDEKNKMNQRMIHRNPLVEKMLQGQRDEQFVQDYYEILKKADKFLRTSSPEKIAMAADKYGMNFGQKDRWGRRYEHYGFYDPKNKNYGKTLAEAMKAEVEERKTKDDDFPLEFMFDNSPLEDGIGKVDEIVESKQEVSNTGFEAMNSYEKAKRKNFPLKIIREKDVPNKIEQLTDYLHIKRVNSKHRILEFFIPAKYKTFDIDEKSDMFTELTNIDQVWLTDEYGGKYGYVVTEYRKRLLQTVQITKEGVTIDEPTFEVIKLNGTKIEKMV